METQFCFRYEEDTKYLLEKSKEFIKEFLAQLEKDGNVYVEDKELFDRMYGSIFESEIGDIICMNKGDVEVLIGIVDTLSVSITNSEPPYTDNEMKVLKEASKLVNEYKDFYKNEHLFY